MKILKVVPVEGRVWIRFLIDWDENLDFRINAYMAL
jgi:hypothetical protein